MQKNNDNKVTLFNHYKHKQEELLMQPKAVITGITGQDGAYLARLLICAGYQVFGTTRSLSSYDDWRLKIKGIDKKIQIIELPFDNYEQLVIEFKKIKPTLIFHLSAMSSVSESFNNIEGCFQSIINSTNMILKYIKENCVKETKLVFAASSECFGDHGKTRITETTPLTPLSPYAVAKTTAIHMIKTYRAAYSLQTSICYLFNHDSSLRDPKFVTRKISQSAKLIFEGKTNNLELQNPAIIRDWGYAGEHMQAFFKVGEQTQSEDYIIATGKSHSLEDLVREIFAKYDIPYETFVTSVHKSLRPNDIIENYASPNKIYQNLGWKSQITLSQLANKLLQ